jgi:hypothetical protein
MQLRKHDAPSFSAAHHIDYWSSIMHMQLLRSSCGLQQHVCQQLVAGNVNMHVQFWITGRDNEDGRGCAARPITYPGLERRNTSDAAAIAAAVSPAGSDPGC